MRRLARLRPGRKSGPITLVRRLSALLPVTSLIGKPHAMKILSRIDRARGRAKDHGTQRGCPMRTFSRAVLPAVLVLGIVTLAPAAAAPPHTPMVGVFPVTYFSQQQVTGHVISNAVSVPPAAIGQFYKGMGDPVGGPASAFWSLEFSCDGGLTWPCSTG